MRKALSGFLGGVALAWLAASADAAPLLVYSNDFDGSVSCAAGSCLLGGATGTTAVPAGFAAIGFSGSMLHNASAGNPATATTLTLSGLPAHDSIDISFLLAVIDSWDSTNGSPAPDFFNVTLDSTSLLIHTYSNASGSVTDLTGTDIGSGCVGRGFSGYCDRAYDTSTYPGLSVAHSASTATIDFFASGAGWQAGGDESWGMDNLHVTINTVTTPPPPPPPGVPAPATLVLLGLGLTALGGWRLRRS